MKSTRYLHKAVATIALVLIPTTALANPIQSSSQSISSSTLANGNGAVATSQTSQSIYQSAATVDPYSQVVIQGADVHTAAVGDHAVAATQLNQAVSQTLWETGTNDWIDVYNQMMVQQATLDNYAFGDWSQAVTQIDQISEQYGGGY